MPEDLRMNALPVLWAGPHHRHSGAPSSRAWRQTVQPGGYLHSREKRRVACATGSKGRGALLLKGFTRRPRQMLDKPNVPALGLPPNREPGGCKVGQTIALPSLGMLPIRWRNVWRRRPHGAGGCGHDGKALQQCDGDAAPRLRAAASKWYVFPAYRADCLVDP